jgi:membrane-associated phospholipid phosphatase
VEGAGSLLPVDRVFILYNLVLGIALTPSGVAEPKARFLVAGHLLGFLLPLVLLRYYRPNQPWLSALRELYPLLCLPLFWAELGVRHAWVDTSANDRMVAALELLLFGYQPSVEWKQWLAGGVLGEGISAWYGSYYLLLAAVPLLVWAARRKPTVGELVYRVTLTYLSCFLIYILFPVAGPREFFPVEETPMTGWFAGINDSIRNYGDSLGTAFPSSHVAGSMTLAWVAWRSCSRALASACGLIAAGMAFAVVVTGNHFVLDSVAAVFLVLVVQGIVAPALHRRWGTARPSPVETLASGALGANPAEASPA